MEPPPPGRVRAQPGQSGAVSHDNSTVWSVLSFSGDLLNCICTCNYSSIPPKLFIKLTQDRAGPCEDADVDNWRDAAGGGGEGGARWS